MVENNCKNPRCIDGKIYIPLENGKISEDNFDECPDCGSVDYHEVLRNLNRGRITVSEAHDIYKQNIKDLKCCGNCKIYKESNFDRCPNGIQIGVGEKCDNWKKDTTCPTG